MEESPCLMASVGEHTFAIPLQWIRNIAQTPEILTLPQTPPHIRGTVNILDAWTALVDMRQLCGLRTMQEERGELVDSLHLQQSEHERWVDELVDAAQAQARFSGEVNPHKCAFGRRYANFEHHSPRLTQLFRLFGDAHEQLHAVATEVRDFQRVGQHAEAAKRANDARRVELARMNELFDRAFSMLEEAPREVTVSIEPDGQPLAIAVDTVHRVELVHEVERTVGQPIAKYGDNSHAILLESSFLLAA